MKLTVVQTPEASATLNVFLLISEEPFPSLDPSFKYAGYLERHLGA